MNDLTPSVTNSQLTKGAPVCHLRHGSGIVMMTDGITAVVRFEHGIEECEIGALEHLTDVVQKIGSGDCDVPNETINRVQAECIRSVNAMWGVFSRSRINLLPHQLWVCRRVNAQWPTHWLVADDVGLGKTIEAGMILWPLLARGRVRRVLIICPASLVEQWQYRMRTMFDIRMTPYLAEADKPKADFWNTQDAVIVSLQTLRMDHKGRHKRLIEAEPWDILLVDEAHHLGADEQGGQTLGYRIVKDLLDNKRVNSVVFFTGTPHRGKDYQFLALLQLLRPDLFTPREPIANQLKNLPQVLIRNNKNNVTDMEGNKLFQETIVTSETYAYSPDEALFYDQLTQFITTGQAYASQLSSGEGRAVMLVLIAMQKLASSSVAAIRRAIAGRLSRVQSGQQEFTRLQTQYQEWEESGDGDALAELEEQIAEVASSLQLMRNEEPALRELLHTAEKVDMETKITTIIEAIKVRFVNRQVLFFTEYKATQALLISALQKYFGPDCATFINGDSRLADVVNENGERTVLQISREAATQRFNSGKCRFLISTEAGGEGIDLQERCHTLVHVDLPWNPMRLHQRVGRLNRYGQKERVEVLSLRNPDTVEALIWEHLNAKLGRITRALGAAMDQPEDMLQLVLGMANPSLFRGLFSQAEHVPRENLKDWFDNQTATFGGQDAINAVRDLVGNACKFDFGQASQQLPRVDLPDLRPFFELALHLNGRRLRDANKRKEEESEESSNTISFLTPDEWRTDPAIRQEYSDTTFERLAPELAQSPHLLMGAGHKAFEAALAQASKRDAAFSIIPSEILPYPIAVFRIQDRLTGGDQGARSVIAAITEEDKLVLDWQLLQILNTWPWRKTAFSHAHRSGTGMPQMQTFMHVATKSMEKHLASLDHGLRLPRFDPFAVFWPMPTIEI